MDFYETQKQRTVNKHSSSAHKGKKRLTEDQVSLLEKSFTPNKKLDPERRLQLAVELGVPPRQVAIWYQNRMARWKTRTLEIDHNALQVKLDPTLAENRELERDVERLSAELRLARERFAFAGLNSQTQEPDNNINLSTGSCKEGCWSCSWEEDEYKTLQLDDLYACVMFENSRHRG